MSKKNKGNNDEEETEEDKELRRKLHKAIDEAVPDDMIEGRLGIIQDKTKNKDDKK